MLDFWGEELHCIRYPFWYYFRDIGFVALIMFHGWSCVPSRLTMWFLGSSISWYGQVVFCCRQIIHVTARSQIVVVVTFSCIRRLILIVACWIILSHICRWESASTLHSSSMKWFLNFLMALSVLFDMVFPGVTNLYLMFMVVIVSLSVM